ncbi:MAG: TolC family protein [Leptospira sp.]|nr:TolC family protein [Leptospira sp.]
MVSVSTALFLFFFLEVFNTLGAEEKESAESRNESAIEDAIAKWDLSQIEEYATRNNPLYLAEKQNVNAARGDLITASLYRNPMLVFQEQFVPAGGSPTTNIFGSQVSSGGAPEIAPGFTQDIDINGIVSQRVRVSKHAFQVQIANFSDFDRLFRLRLRQNYWSYLYIKELLDFQKEFYENYKDLLELNRFRAEKGDISPLELDRLELERVRIEKDYRDAEILRAQIAKNIRVLIGVPPQSKILDLKGRLDFFSTAELKIDLEEFDIEDRADLAALKSRMMQSQLNIELKRRENKSYLNLGGEVRKKGNESYFGIFATIPLRIFDRGQGEILKAEELHKKSVLEVEAKRREILAEVNAAKRELKSREELLLSYRATKLLDKNKSVKEKSTLAFIRGASNLVTFLEADRNYFNLLKGYYELIYLYYNAIESYRASVGRLGTNIAEDSTIK